MCRNARVRQTRIDRWTDRQMLIEIPRLHICSAVETDWRYTQNYENPLTLIHCQAAVHRPNVSFIHKQSINSLHGITVTILVITLIVTFLVTNTILTKKRSYNNANQTTCKYFLPMDICSCSSPVPLLAPTLKSGGARAPPGYMAPEPLPSCIFYVCAICCNVFCRKLRFGKSGWGI